MEADGPDSMIHLDFNILYIFQDLFFLGENLIITNYR